MNAGLQRVAEILVAAAVLAGLAVLGVETGREPSTSLRIHEATRAGLVQPLLYWHERALACEGRDLETPE